MRALQFTADRGGSYSRLFRGKNLTKTQFSSSDKRNSTPRSSTFVVEPLIKSSSSEHSPNTLYSVNSATVIYVNWIQLIYIRLCANHVMSCFVLTLPLLTYSHQFDVFFLCGATTINFTFSFHAYFDYNNLE
jgi:hypothetical protein